MNFILRAVFVAAMFPSYVFATGAAYPVPTGPFGPMYPQGPADVRWLDAARIGERQIVGRVVYIDLRDHDGFYFSVKSSSGWVKPSAPTIEGILISVTDQGSPFFYTLRLRSGQIVTIVVGGAKNYAELQQLRWVK